MIFENFMEGRTEMLNDRDETCVTWYRILLLIPFIGGCVMWILGFEYENKSLRIASYCIWVSAWLGDRFVAKYHEYIMNRRREEAGYTEMEGGNVENV